VRQFGFCEGGGGDEVGGFGGGVYIYRDWGLDRQEEYYEILKRGVLDLAAM